MLKEVRFDIWCEKCQYNNTPETDDPCNECLARSNNSDSTKPIDFKEGNDGH